MPLLSHPGACRCSACSRTGCVNLLMGCHPLGRARSWYSNTSNCRLLLSGEVERITCQCSCCTFTQLPEAAASRNSSVLMSSDEEMLSLLLRCFASSSAFFCGRPCAPLINGIVTRGIVILLGFWRGEGAHRWPPSFVSKLLLGLLFLAGLGCLRAPISRSRRQSLRSFLAQWRQQPRAGGWCGPKFQLVKAAVPLG